MPKKRKTRRRRRRGGLGRLLRPLSVLLTAVAVVAALTMFFKVSTVEVTGSSRYRDGEVAAASGVELGDNLVLLDKYRIAQRIYTELPYVTEARINRKFPSTLVLEVTETTAVASIQGAGGYWLLSAKGKLVEAAEESAAAEEQAIAEGHTPAEETVWAKRCSPGLYPDLLRELKGGRVKLYPGQWHSLWITVECGGKKWSREEYSGELSEEKSSCEPGWPDSCQFPATSPQ